MRRILHGSIEITATFQLDGDVHLVATQGDGEGIRRPVRDVITDQEGARRIAETLRTLNPSFEPICVFLESVARGHGEQEEVVP